jgi:aspartyl-tRNA(Asn)/glutamyl-tRNA(Gln) amidotransferase subunit A
VTILDAAEQLKSGTVTSIQLLETAFAAIAEQDGDLNAFISVIDEPARTRAQALDSELAQGKCRGPLHGVPVAVKDLFHTKGIRTTGGSKLFEEVISTFDAAVVERLEAAGAVIVGKTNLHELAYGVTSNNPHFGAVHNPHKLDCVPGGSSGGSAAAVAAGIVPMAMGTDTGGSIRIPAAFCGTVGLKPTFGRVSKFGCMPLGLSLDHMGPLTMTVRDTAVTMDAIAGHDPRDPNTSTRPVDSYLPPENPSLKGVRIGWPVNFYFDSLDPDVRKSVERTRTLAESLGAVVIDVRVPDIAALNTISRVVLMSEASAVLERYMGDRSKFGVDVLALLDQGRLLPATDYVNAQRARRVMQQEFRSLFERIDCLFTPASPIPAPRIDQKTVLIDGAEEDVRLASTRFVRAINAVGLPALSLPCGSSSAGLPIGLQIVGRAFEEKFLLEVGAALELAICFTI